jgi:hypothetical protein
VLDAMIDVHLRLSTCVQKKDEPSASIAIVLRTSILSSRCGFPTGK